jgi:hypothetical protein
MCLFLGLMRKYRLLETGDYTIDDWTLAIESMISNRWRDLSYGDVQLAVHQPVTLERAS